MPLEDALQVEEFLPYAPNMKIYGVTRKNCIKALQAAKNKIVGLNDAINKKKNYCKSGASNLRYTSSKIGG